MTWVDLLYEIVFFTAGIVEIWQFIKKSKNGKVLIFYDKLSLAIGVLYILKGVYYLNPLSDTQDVWNWILGIVLVGSVIIQCIYEKKLNF